MAPSPYIDTPTIPVGETVTEYRQRRRLVHAANPSDPSRGLCGTRLGRRQRSGAEKCAVCLDLVNAWDGRWITR